MSLMWCVSVAGRHIYLGVASVLSLAVLLSFAPKRPGASVEHAKSDRPSAAGASPVSRGTCIHACTTLTIICWVHTHRPTRPPFGGAHRPAHPHIPAAVLRRLSTQHAVGHLPSGPVLWCVSHERQEDSAVMPCALAQSPSCASSLGDYRVRPAAWPLCNLCSSRLFDASGMRMRLPESLLAGMMWFDPRRPDALANLRHEAQERDGRGLTNQKPHVFGQPAM
jgi:Glycosyl hydrolase family 63 N-terminal domain